MEHCKLTSQIVGDGPPLVILHGLFGSGRNWGSIARALSSDHQVHTLDLRNHGASPWSDTMRYDVMAADVEAYLETQDIAPCDLLGHSMGGKVAMTLALTAPALVRRLIVVDIAPVTYRHDSNATYAAAMLAAPLSALKRRTDMDTFLQTAIPDPTIRAFLLQNLETTDGGGFQWRLNLQGIVNNMAEIVDFPTLTSQFKKPTTFIAGERSDYIRPRDEAAIRAYFPQAHLIEIGDAGHWPHAERPERFVQIVKEAQAGS